MEIEKEETGKSVSEFIAAVSAGSPTPGGGSVSALAGSLASALVEMVANLTLDKKGFEGKRERMAGIRDAARDCCGLLQAAVSEDIRAYRRLMEAYRLPRGDEEEQRIRSVEIQKRLRGAADVPFHVAGICLRVLEICARAVRDGNPNAVTDGGVGGLLAHAALEGSILNVRVNLSGLHDRTYAGSMERDLSVLKRRGGEIKEQILQIVSERMESS